MDDVAAFIAKYGVTRCPTVALEPTQATIPAFTAPLPHQDGRKFKTAKINSRTRIIAAQKAVETKRKKSD